jgi:chemotaxis protein CheX
MPATDNNIAEYLIRENVVRAVADVFKTMLGYTAKLQVPAAGADSSEPRPLAARALPHIVGSVGFIGEINGVVYLYLEEAFAVRCTGDMLGLSERELAETDAESVNDAIGELTNMMVGSFKNGLCDAGYPCKLTIPSILRGSNFSVEPISSAQRHVFSFECRGHRIVADVLLKSED